MKSSLHLFNGLNFNFYVPEGRLIVAEETSKGKVTFRTYGVYMKAAGGFIISGLVLLVYVISIGVGTGTSWWLSYWLQQGGGVSLHSLTGYFLAECNFVNLH